LLRGFVSGKAGALGVPRHAVPVMRDQHAGADPDRKAHSLAIVEVSDEPGVLPEPVSAIDREQRDLDSHHFEVGDERRRHDGVTSVQDDGAGSADHVTEEAPPALGVAVCDLEPVRARHDADLERP